MISKDVILAWLGRVSKYPDFITQQVEKQIVRNNRNKNSFARGGEHSFYSEMLQQHPMMCMSMSFKYQFYTGNLCIFTSEVKILTPAIVL